ncbi:MAG: hypothetical protein H7X80_02575 [bacterium]|nr:hypothetical protein [Candidatus Kapabacteria bacterium]
MAVALTTATELLAQTTTCLPSCSTTDGRFLSLAGSKYKTLSGDEIAIVLCAPSGSTSISFDIFDGESSGIWDAGTAPLVYKLYSDSAAGGDGTFKVGEWKGDIMTNNGWFGITVNHDSRALSRSGRYFYVLKIRMGWGDDTDANNIEDDAEDTTARKTWSNFKIRSTATMSTKQFSFCAPLFSLTEAAVIYPSWPLITPTTYDGSWSLFFNSRSAISTLELWDGDMDFGSWNGTSMDNNDPNTNSGNPPRWSGAGAVNEGVAVGLDKVRDALGGLTQTISTGSPMDDNLSLSYRRSPSIKYSVVDPYNNTYYNNNPSGNSEWEKFSIGTNGEPTSQTDTTANSLPPGNYKIAITGMDLHNINSWRYEGGMSGVTDSNTASAALPSAACVETATRRLTSGSQTEFSLELWPDGSLYAWGDNDYGQIGDSTTTDRWTPVRVKRGDFPGTTFLGDVCGGTEMVGAASNTAFALMTDGMLYSWGRNDYGQLGQGHLNPSYVPRKVLKGAYPGTTYLGDNPNDPIKFTANGYGYNYALTASGRVYGWGSNFLSQLLDSTTTDRTLPVRAIKGAYSGTRYLGDNVNNPIIQLAVGRWVTLALAADGTIYSWGLGSRGQLGDGTTTLNRTAPVRVLKGAYTGTTYLGDNASNKVKQIACMDSTAFALMTDGTVYSWGFNGNGELGNGNTGTNQTTPVRVLKGAYSGTTYLGDNTANKITWIGAGEHHAAVLTATGQVFAWGRNQYGQLGDNSTTNRNTPVRVLKGAYTGTTFLGDGAQPIDRLGIGKFHCTALGQGDYKTYTWGYNGMGRLGNNSTTNSSVPVQVNQGARPYAKAAVAGADDASAEIARDENSGVAIGGIGVYEYANQIYMTFEAKENTIASIDIYNSTSGEHIARPIDKQLFEYGRQRFGIRLPDDMRSGSYIIAVTSDKGVSSQSFVYTR